jgi:hypothetical protein
MWKRSRKLDSHSKQLAGETSGNASAVGNNAGIHIWAQMGTTLK